MKSLKIFLILFCASFILTSCLEEIPLTNSESKSFLVIESTITNEYKFQTVKLSRTIELDSLNSIKETNAIVVIKDDSNNSFNFTETDDGIYVSNNEFEAELNKNYTLEITTKDGKRYTSKQQKIAGVNEMDSLEAKLGTKTNGEEGINIVVNSNTTDENAQYYRYEYEETYKIIAPLWSNQKLEIIIDEFPFSEVALVTDPVDNKICYNTINSSDIIQTETTLLSGNDVNFNVHFLGKNDFKVSHRYSVLVKQYVENLEAYTYFNTLKKLSESQGIFTQNQPGLVVGNISSVSDIDENVIGFFEVVSVSEKRIFFNYEEYYPDGEVDYISDCVITAPPLLAVAAFPGQKPPQTSPLVNALKQNSIFYLLNSEPTEQLIGNYLLVPRECGDCTVLGSNVKPTFWID
ncbi:protein of unknown function [Polaribacter sp. KT25b]|uniref:DUF4249 domain-containing protein n=1 Tax=Polaribacter sp. KT25b TaxID=1855336 RepID=UPI00087BB86F|nr:DUF4249 domain-containing protein [Polaribacter sp. KT25b]SDS16663.1 protein of unknown function [Polaribacter sp. KT25b]